MIIVKTTTPRKAFYLGRNMYGPGYKLLLTDGDTVTAFIEDDFPFSSRVVLIETEAGHRLRVKPYTLRLLD